jgi:hypothetical protein
MIESAKSGRAKCRKCKEPIAKGELRFGEETVNAFSDSGEPSYFWYHLACAAKAKPKLLQAELEKHSGEIPNREELMTLMQKAAGKEKPTAFPYGERAPTARSRCIACEEPIDKDAFRIAVEREVDTGAFVTKGPGYLHPACASDYLDDDSLVDHLRSNTTTLPPPELETLLAELEG